MTGPRLAIRALQTPILALETMRNAVTTIAMRADDKEGHSSFLFFLANHLRYIHQELAVLCDELQKEDSPKLVG